MEQRGTSEFNMRFNDTNADNVIFSTDMEDTTCRMIQYLDLSSEESESNLEFNVSPNYNYNSLYGCTPFSPKQCNQYVQKQVLEVGKNQRPFSQECKRRNNECGDSKSKTIDLTESFDQIFKEDLGNNFKGRTVNLIGFTPNNEAAKYQHQISTNNNFISAPIESSRKFQLRNVKESNDKEQTLINEINRLIKIRSAKRRIKEKPLKSIETTLDGLQVLRDLLIESNEDKENENKSNLQKPEYQPIDPNLIKYIAELETDREQLIQYASELQRELKLKSFLNRVSLIRLKIRSLFFSLP